MRPTRALCWRAFTLTALAVVSCGDDESTTPSDGGGTSSTGGGGMGGSSTSTGEQVCGNGVLEGTEQCDDGNLTTGDGCDNDCDLTCVDDGDCDDADPCNGTETCESDNTCGATASLPDGTSCGATSICIGGTCVAGSCGDGQTSGAEECDDGNAILGDGCDNDCTFSCASTNPSKSCASTDPCIGNGTCDDASHTCVPGLPVMDGASCGVGQICLNGACSLEQCGDGFVASSNEQCDFGAGNGAGTGCELNCQFSCTTNPDSCDDGEPCNGVEVCTTNTGPNSGTGQVCMLGSPLNDGTACGPGMFCMSGTCTIPSCGNGIIEAGEQCDLGASNGPNTGCELSCQLSCTMSPNSCADTNACNGAEACTSAVVNGQTVQFCQSGMNATQCASCSGGVCDGGGSCVASTCGDGCVNMAAGEQCEPPNTPSCSATCTANPVCGNGVIEGAEQCDDGNLSKLDGCDSNCKYEVVGRMTSVTIQGTAAPASCTPNTNRFGTQSLTGTAINSLNGDLQDGIDNGTTNILTQLIGLDDLTGVADPNGLSIGVLSGIPDPARGTWPGNNPIDWWFLGLASALDANNDPLSLLTNGTLAARQLAAGPNTIDLTLLLGGSPAVLKMRSARIAGTLDGTPAPNVPAPPPTLANGLTVFQTITATGTNQGLCGNITIESLSKIPAPQSLSLGGSTPCGNCSGSKEYTYCGMGMPVGPGCNSLLDVLVGGCKVIACFVTTINARQPDVAGTDGDVDTLTLGVGNKIPQSQVTGNDDAYSSYFKFTANRTHITGKQ